MKHLLHTLCIAAAIVAGTVHAATDATSPQGLLKGKLPDDAAGLKRVAVGNFFVQYVTDFGLEMKRSSNTFYSKLKDVPPETLQATSNALHARLLAELKAAGLDVVPAEDVAAAPAMAELARIGKTAPVVVNDSTIKKISTLVGASGLPVILLTVPDQKLSKVYTEPLEGTYAKQLVNWEQQASEWLLAGNAETFSAAGIFTNQQKLAESLRATVLSVRLTVPFVDMGIEQKVGGFGVSLFGGGDQGRVVANPRFVEGGTVFAFAQAGGNPGHMTSQVMALQKPVPLQGLKFEFEKGAPRDGGGLVGALLGAAGAGSDKADFLVKLDATALQAALVEAAQPVFKDLARTLADAK
jgi:hypothetical protein